MTDDSRSSDDPQTDDDSARCARLAEAELTQRYRSTLTAATDDPEVESEFEAWREYVRDRHGDVFARLAVDSVDEASGESSHEKRTSDAAGALFAETLTFDFLLTRLLDELEAAFGCEARRPLASDAPVSFGADFEGVHERVLSRMRASEATSERRSTLTSEREPDPTSTFGSLATDFVESASPYDVARLHRECVSPLTRRAFGRYDTPGGVAELAVGTLFEGVEVAGEDADAGTPSSDADTPDSDVDTPNSDVGTPTPDVGTSAPLTDPLIVDPGCGAGAFLAAAAQRLISRKGAEPPSECLDSVIDSVRGFDLSPTAVRASRLAIALAVRPLLEAVDESPLDETPRVSPRVVLGDAALATPETSPLNGQRADCLLMNPPWITWDSLSERVKDRWRRASEANRAPVLFGHSGLDARLGFANDDLSVPYTIHCLHRLLRDGGRASVVLKRDLLTGPAGRRLRNREIADRRVRYDRVHDFDSLAPFPDVDAGTALFGCRVTASGGAPGSSDPSASSGSPDSSPPLPTDEGVPTTHWRHVETPETDPEGTSLPAEPFSSLAAMRDAFDTAETSLVPTDPETPSSPWIRADAERRALGPCPYRIRHGVKDDAKAVYALDRETIARHELESEHIYPYLKSKHIVKYGLFGHDLQLVPQQLVNDDNEDELRRKTPATYAYLNDHRDRLLDRSSSWFDDGPFYSLFGLGPYTWADYKVVWCRLGFKPHFAVVSTVSDPTVGEKTVVPGDHCMFVGTDDEREAHYLCALLNSAPYQRCLRDISSGGKSSLSKSTVERLALPEWTGAAPQRQLASLSQRAHEIVPEHVDCSKRAYNEKTIPELAAVQSKIDREVEQFLVALASSRNANRRRERGP
ncbi:type I restriction endonuclease subunit M [Halobellus salinisoli]|uniref:type I restriction endonuclease subunit M n=1 Tax=Halobellus salinisoli TaxID=3108500 RepID=UPI0030096DA5